MTLPTVKISDNGTINAQDFARAWHSGGAYDVDGKNGITEDDYLLALGFAIEAADSNDQVDVPFDLQRHGRDESLHFEGWTEAMKDAYALGQTFDTVDREGDNVQLVNLNNLEMAAAGEFPIEGTPVPESILNRSPFEDNSFRNTVELVIKSILGG